MKKAHEVTREFWTVFSPKTVSDELLIKIGRTLRYSKTWPGSRKLRITIRVEVVE